MLNKAQTAMYADDSTIYAAGSSIDMINDILDNELRLVVK